MKKHLDEILKLFIWFSEQNVTELSSQYTPTKYGKHTFEFKIDCYEKESNVQRESARGYNLVRRENHDSRVYVSAFHSCGNNDASRSSQELGFFTRDTLAFDV